MLLIETSQDILEVKLAVQGAQNAMQSIGKKISPIISGDGICRIFIEPRAELILCLFIQL